MKLLFLCLPFVLQGALLRKPAAPVAQKVVKLDPDVAAKFDDLGKQTAKASWNKPERNNGIPAHLIAPPSTTQKNHTGCHQKVPLSLLGISPSEVAKQVWHTSFLSQPVHPGRESFAVPGSGGTQTLKDEGRSTIGSVAGEEPYVKVLKDGFSEVGCFTDAMNEFGDKFGDEKDKFKGQLDGVSIVRYEELVLKDEQKPMTPLVCFEFCRTLPDMVFFGITNGRNCYCAPYYKSAAGDDKKCDSGCEGDPTAMCGNQKKSTIWEMHLCDDTAGDLVDAMDVAKSTMDFFYEMAVLSKDLAGRMTEGGQALQKVAGASGAPRAADNGQAAMAASKPLSQGYQAGFNAYETLLGAHQTGETLKTADFSLAVKATEAEKTTRTLLDAERKVMGAANAMRKSVKLAYPAFASLKGDQPNKADSIAMALAKPDDGSFDFRVASYAIDTAFAPTLSTCTGPIIGSPMVGMSFSQCAKACSATTYPTKCVAFSHYVVDSEGGALRDLCFMLADITTFTTFQCESLLGCAPGKKTAPRDECKDSAICMVKMSEIATGYKPNAKWTKADRCFGSPAAGASFTPYAMPALGSSATLLGGKVMNKAF